MGKVAFLFPGQGSQTVGMSQDFWKHNEQAADIFAQADDAIDLSVSDLAFQGPEEQLTLTANTQPALLTASIAALQAVKAAGLSPDYVAGHSLGEYSALVAAGSLSFRDAVHTVRQRGLLMEEAVPAGQGGMAAVLGLDTDRLQHIVEDISTDEAPVQLANLNAPGQIVISGAKTAVEQAGERAEAEGAKRVIPLEVSGPFHSILMAPAADRFNQVLEGITIQDADVPLIANVSAESITSRTDIHTQLMKQLYSPVRWEETIQYLFDQGVDTFLEIGPGKVLSGLVKRVKRRAKTFAINDQESLQKAISKIKETD